MLHVEGGIWGSAFSNSGNSSIEVSVRLSAVIDFIFWVITESQGMRHTPTLLVALILAL